MSRPPLPANRPLPVYRSPLPPPLDLIYSLAINLSHNGSSVINLFFAQPNVGHYEKLKNMRDFELNNLCTNASNNQSSNQSINQFDVLAIGKLFKDILNREKPLFSYELFDRLIDVQKRFQTNYQSNEQSINQTNNEKCAELSKLIHQSMDSDHRLVLNEVIKLFDKLIECSIITQSTSDKLSYAFGPALIRPDPNQPINPSNLMAIAQNTKFANELLKFIIEHRQQIFNQSTAQSTQSHSQPNSPAINPPVSQSNGPSNSQLPPPNRPFSNSSSHPSLASFSQHANQMSAVPPPAPVYHQPPPPINQSFNQPPPIHQSPPSTMQSARSPVILHDHLSPTTMHQMTISHPPPPPPPSVSSSTQHVAPPAPPAAPVHHSGPPAPPSFSTPSAPGPPAPGPPAPPSMTQTTRVSSSQPADRGALLSGIQGFKGGLRKTQTVDKSAPLIEGKTNNPSSSQSDNHSSTQSIKANLGGLFAGGMPTLRKSVGGPPPVTQSNNQSSNQAGPPSRSSFSAGPPALPSNTQSAAQSSSYNLPPPPPPMSSGPPPINQSVNSPSRPPPAPGPPMPPQFTQSSNPPPPPGPPVPAAPAAPAAPVFSIRKTSVTASSGSGNDRGALLAGIQGFKGGLRKTQTVDKSAPLIEGKANDQLSSNQSSTGGPPPRPSIGQSSGAAPAMSMQDEIAARMARMRASRGG